MRSDGESDKELCGMTCALPSLPQSYKIGGSYEI